MLKSVPVALVIVLPDPAVNVPSTVARLTPVVVLLALLIVTNGRFAVTVVRLAAGPPVASIEGVPVTTIWKPVPVPELKAAALEADRPVPADVKMSRSVKLRSPFTVVNTRPFAPTPLPLAPICVLPPDTVSNPTVPGTASKVAVETLIPVPPVLPLMLLLAKL